MSGPVFFRQGVYLRRWWLGGALLLAAPLAGALETTISAQYLGGGSGRFDNTTPPTGLCQYWAALCSNRGTVELPISYVKRSINKAPDTRDQYYYKLPGRKEVVVYHDQTGEPHRMTFDFTSVSQKTTVQGNPNNSPAKGSPRGGCTGGASLSFLSTRTVVFYRLILDPQSPQPCWSSDLFEPEGVVDVSTVTEMGVAYTLDMPPPYRLKEGSYRGSVTYSIGPGGDFDFGNGVSQLNGNSLLINFVLEVKHAFFFDFPPGSERAVLEPPGGWNAWLSGGRVPQRIYRDLPFRLWSTGPLKVYKLCQHYVGDHCGIRNDGNEQAPVEVALSLPSGIQHQGNAVSRLVLPTGRPAALQLESVTPVLNRPGQLHFEVGRDDVRDMLAHPGTTYTGQVTVVFDAEL